MYTIVIPELRNPRMIANSSCVSRGESDAVGSSMIRTCARRFRAFSTSTCCCFAGVSSATIVSGLSMKP